jgi:hypothetical protein
MKMVDQHSERVKDLFKAYEVATGRRDEIEIMEKMPTPFPLNTYDLRTILLFKEQLTSRMEKDAIQSVNWAVAKVRLKYTYERYTRVRDHIANIASAKAFERALREGTVKPDTKEIHISRTDVEEASEMIDLVFSYYDGRMENEKATRKEFYQVSATPEQKFIIDTLKDRYKAGGSRDACSMPLDLLCDSFRSKYGTMDWGFQIFPLLAERIVAYDGMNLIWLPDEMEDGLVHALFVGDSQRDFVSTENLRKLHLLDDSLLSGWMATLPLQSTEEVQKLVRGLCVQTPVKLEDLKIRAGLNSEVADNALMYMHLSGELWHTEKGYMARPRNDSK